MQMGQCVDILVKLQVCKATNRTIFLQLSVKPHFLFISYTNNTPCFVRQSIVLQFDSCSNHNTSCVQYKFDLWSHFSVILLIVLVFFYFCFSEYYFSTENLAKDVYLRQQVLSIVLPRRIIMQKKFLFDGVAITYQSLNQISMYSIYTFIEQVPCLFVQMDVDGYIPISLIASFYRVQALSQDQDLILQVCNTL